MKLSLVFAPIAASVVALTTPAAHAATFTVTKTADTADGVCDADCSLREAVVASNADDLVDAIVVPAGTYVFSIAGADEDAGATGDLDITGPVTVTGAGAATTVVNANGIDRVFHVRSDLARVVFEGLTVRGGTAPGSGAAGYGGGVYGFRSVVDAYNCVFTANSAVRGGAVYIEAQGAEPYVTALHLSGSTITANTAVTSGGGVGLFAATARISHSTLTNNIATGNGGAIDTGLFSQVEIVDSVLTNNEAGQGGGVYENQSGAAGLVSFRDSTIANNRAGGKGGGVFADSANTVFEASRVRDNQDSVSACCFNGAGISAEYGTLQIMDTEVTGNTGADSGGGASIFFQTVTIQGSTISGNSADKYGGGLSITFGAVTIENSTISGNSVASAVGDNGVKGGGGIGWNRFGRSVTTLTNVTVADNTSGTEGEQLSCSACGADYPITLRNTVVAGSGTLDNCLGVIASEGGNLSTDVSCGFDDPSDQESVADVKLGALAANGGPTDTRALQTGSPAIGAAVPANCPAVDQRGFQRDGMCDSGAFEANVSVDNFGCGEDLNGLRGQLRYVVEEVLGVPTVGDILYCLGGLAGAA